MKKEDLKTGHLVFNSVGEKFIVLKNSAHLNEDIASYIGENSSWDFLRNAINSNKLIDKVYKPACGGFLDDLVIMESIDGDNANDWELIYERKPEKTIEFDGVEYSESTLRSLIKKATE